MRKVITIVVGLLPWAAIAVIAAIAAVSAASDEVKRDLTSPVSITHLRQ